MWNGIDDDVDDNNHDDDDDVAWVGNGRRVKVLFSVGRNTQLHTCTGRYPRLLLLLLSLHRYNHSGW